MRRLEYSVSMDHVRSSKYWVYIVAILWGSLVGDRLHGIGLEERKREI